MAFPTTSWTMVNEARSNSTRREAARNALFATYGPPLRVYAMNKYAIGTEHLDDLLQGFFVHSVER